MAGRHSAHHIEQAGPSRRSGRRIAVVAAALVALAATGTAVAVQMRHRDHSIAASQTAAVPCAGSVSVPVIAAPDIAAPARQVATQWMATKPQTSGRCIAVTVTAQDSAAAQRALAAKPRLATWIPDSTLWSGLLTASSPAVAPAVQVEESVASTPLVLASPPGQSGALDSVAKAGWRAAMTGPANVTIPDPTTTSGGALIALTLQTQAGSAPGASAALVGTFVRLAAAPLPTTSAGFADLQAHPASARPFVASEQDVLLANRARGSAVATAVYPGGASPFLDFPAVRITPAGSDPVLTEAGRLFTAQLRTPNAQHIFAAAGLRDTTGSPLQNAGDTVGVTGQPVTAAPAPVAAKLANAARLWRAATRPSRLLAVVDVSGSMGDPAGNGQSKIATAAEAAQYAMKIIPDSWTMAMWAFSVQPPPQTDWTQLVGFGPVRQQRSALIAAAGTLPTRVGGDTALYDTALSAFDQMTRTYDPASVNVVALLTDGADHDPDGPGLGPMLARLRDEFRSSRPIKIVTIGLGKDADVDALRQISAATQGQSYTVTNPSDIRGVLLDSIVANN